MGEAVVASFHFLVLRGHGVGVSLSLLDLLPGERVSHYDDGVCCSVLIGQR